MTITDSFPEFVVHDIIEIHNLETPVVPFPHTLLACPQLFYQPIIISVHDSIYQPTIAIIATV